MIDVRIILPWVEENWELISMTHLVYYAPSPKSHETFLLGPTTFEAQRPVHYIKKNHVIFSLSVEMSHP